MTSPVLLDSSAWREGNGGRAGRSVVLRRATGGGKIDDTEDGRARRRRGKWRGVSWASPWRGIGTGGAVGGLATPAWSPRSSQPAWRWEEDDPAPGLGHLP